MASPQVQGTGSPGTGDKSCCWSHLCINSLNMVPRCFVLRGGCGSGPQWVQWLPQAGCAPKSPGHGPSAAASTGASSSRVWALPTATAAGVTRAWNGGSRPVISRFMS